MRLPRPPSKKQRGSSTSYHVPKSTLQAVLMSRLIFHRLMAHCAHMSQRPVRWREADSLLSCDCNSDVQECGSSFAEMRRNSLSSCPTKSISMCTNRTLAAQLRLRECWEVCAGALSLFDYDCVLHGARSKLKQVRQNMMRTRHTRMPRLMHDTSIPTKGNGRLGTLREAIWRG